MTINTGSVSEEHGQYVGQVYQEHYARLRHYFLIQLGDASEADECVQETIRHFFFFMEERNWEEEAEYIFVYLMRIAGLLCSRKLAEKRSQHTTSLTDHVRHSLFNKVRTEALATVKKHVEFVHSMLETGGTNRQPSFPEARRA